MQRLQSVAFRVGSDCREQSRFEIVHLCIAEALEVRLVRPTKVSPPLSLTVSGHTHTRDFSQHLVRTYLAEESNWLLSTEVGALPDVNIDIVFVLQTLNLIMIIARSYCLLRGRRRTHTHNYVFAGHNTIRVTTRGSACLTNYDSLRLRFAHTEAQPASRRQECSR